MRCTKVSCRIGFCFWCVMVAKKILLSDKFSEVRLTTQALNISLTKLLPCHSYLVSVGIVGPIGPGPLSREPLSLATDTREDSPPKTIRATVDVETKDLIVIWEHR